VKKGYILGILFFSALWGLSEASLGDLLYRANIPYASVPMTLIGFMVLTAARSYFPQAGTATLIAVCAMFYKFLNVPSFPCHLLAILLLGAAYDVFFSTRWVKHRALAAALAVYAGNAAFAILMAYVLRYQPWVRAGFNKVFGHVVLSGTLAALACALMVPLTDCLVSRLKTRLTLPFILRLDWVRAGISVVTMGLWVFSVFAKLHRS
jgi:hypothetical protein